MNNYCCYLYESVEYKEVVNNYDSFGLIRDAEWAYDDVSWRTLFSYITGCGAFATLTNRPHSHAAN